MRRLLVSAAVLLAVTAGPAHAATKTYSTGNIDVPIGPTFDRSLSVPDRGPISFVRASFRITTPDASALAITLVSPQGTEVPLVVKTQAGADFGSDERGCGGDLTVLDSDQTTNPIAAATPPFTDGPYRPAGNLASLYGEDAQGRWTLRITKNDAIPARLHCFTLDISREVPESLSAHGRNVKATITYAERDFLYRTLRVSVVRAGRKALDVPIQRIGCPDCAGSRPVDVAVRDLDGGEPEILFDLFTGGAHCCAVSLILRWDAEAHRYRSTFALWGNYGRRLVDLDRRRLAFRSLRAHGRGHGRRAADPDLLRATGEESARRLEGPVQEPRCARDSRVAAGRSGALGQALKLGRPARSPMRRDA